MNDVINGQIVPALGQWEGTMLIVATIAICELVRRLRIRTRTATGTDRRTGLGDAP